MSLTPDRILNALASRLGVFLSICLIGGIAVGGGAYVRHGLSEVQLGQELFQTPRVREGVVAMSDINRLNQVLKETVLDGGFSESRRRNFANALDILYVRWQSFSRLLGTDVAVSDAFRAQAALADIVEISDAFLKDPQPQVEKFSDDLFAASEEARSTLVLYLDELSRTQVAAQERQRDTMVTLTSMLAILLITMSAIGISSVLLLRREVVGRFRREAAERKADFLAYFDPMTGLPNRVQFQETLSDYVARRGDFTVVFVDLDDFKGINDSYGHATGDLVLREVGNRLLARTKGFGGFAARLAGDEFAAILPTENPNKLRFFAREVLEDFERSLMAEGVSLTIGVSLGLAARKTVALRSDATEESMSRAADFALYEAKAAGRGTYRLYDRMLETRYAARRELLDSIPAALANDEFRVAYQPKVDLATREVFGFEALIRWVRDGKIISPGDFLPVAEESRKILELDEFVLDAATRQLAHWNRSLAQPLSVSVNLSALHFEDTRVVGMVEAALDRTGLAPELLTLEMTETVLLEDWRNVQAVLEALRTLGVSISLDDFGTGYSSLAYLRRIAANELKIDRSFVTEIEKSQETRFILDAVIDIAKSLGMSIVVEGIETEIQASIVQSFGCDKGQGYLFGAPILSDDMTDWLMTSKLRRAS